MRRIYRVTGVLLSCIVFASSVAPIQAKSQAKTKAQDTIKHLILANRGYMQQRGAKPVFVKDSLKVNGNITLKAGKTVDGVDVGALAVLVNSIVGLPNCAADEVLQPTVDGWTCAAKEPLNLPSVPASNLVATIDTSSDYVGAGVSVTVGADGLPIMSYVDVTNHDLRVAHCDNATCTSATTTVVSDDSTMNTAIIIGSDGFPVIAHNRYSSSGLVVLKCGNITCSSGNTSTLVDAVVSSFSSISVNANGYPIVAYVDSSAHDLKVTSCGSLDCSSGNLTTTLDADNVSSEQLSLAISQLGYVYISYYSSAANDLKVVTCPLPNCEINMLQTVDSTNDVGRYNSLAIARDGLPVISYYDSTDQNLKFVKCGDYNCTNGAATFSAPITYGDVGAGTSVVMASDGLPIIAYMDATRGHIMFLKCTDDTFVSGGALSDLADLHTTNFSVAHQLSLTFNSNGKPFLAYLDQAGLDLRVISIANSYGVAYLVAR